MQRMKQRIIAVAGSGLMAAGLMVVGAGTAQADHRDRDRWDDGWRGHHCRSVDHWDRTRWGWEHGRHFHSWSEWRWCQRHENDWDWERRHHDRHWDRN